jgi:hypothetical protein
VESEALARSCFGVLLTTAAVGAGIDGIGTGVGIGTEIGADCALGS